MVLAPSSCWADILKSSKTLGLPTGGKTHDGALKSPASICAATETRSKAAQTLPRAEDAERRESQEEGVRECVYGGGVALIFSPHLQAHKRPLCCLLKSQAWGCLISQAWEDEDSCPHPQPSSRALATSDGPSLP